MHKIVDRWCFHDSRYIVCSQNIKTILGLNIEHKNLFKIYTWFRSLVLNTVVFSATHYNDLWVGQKKEIPIFIPLHSFSHRVATNWNLRPWTQRVFHSLWLKIICILDFYAFSPHLHCFNEKSMFRLQFFSDLPFNEFIYST